MKLKEFYNKYPPFNRGAYRIMMANIDQEILAYTVFDDGSVFEAAIIFRKKDGSLGAARNGSMRPVVDVWRYMNAAKFDENKITWRPDLEKEINRLRVIKGL